MDVHASPGPEREVVFLEKWESDEFLMIVEASTYAEVRYRLSYNIKNISFKLTTFAIDAYQSNARRMWKPWAGTSPEPTA